MHKLSRYLTSNVYIHSFEEWASEIFHNLDQFLSYQGYIFIIIILPKKESTYSWPEKLQFADVSPTYFVFNRTKNILQYTERHYFAMCHFMSHAGVSVCGWPEHFSHVRLSSLTMYLFMRNNKLFYISSSRQATNNMGVLVSSFSHLKLNPCLKNKYRRQCTFLYLDLSIMEE